MKVQEMINIYDSRIKLLCKEKGIEDEDIGEFTLKDKNYVILPAEVLDIQKQSLKHVFELIGEKDE